MRSLQLRLESFCGWQKPFISIFELAESGFFYNPSSGIDNVCCAFCRLSLYDFKAFDIPSTEHREYSPTCVKVATDAQIESIMRRLNLN